MGDKAPDFTLKNQVSLVRLSSIAVDELCLSHRADPASFVHQAVAHAAQISQLHAQDGKDVKLSKYQGLFGKPVVRCHTASMRVCSDTHDVGWKHRL